MEETPTIEQLKNLKRKDILTLCKETGIKAVGTNANLIDSLIAHFHPQSESQNDDPLAIQPISKTQKEDKMEPVKLKGILKKPKQLLGEDELSLKPVAVESPQRSYKPFESFSKLFNERTTPLKVAPVGNPTRPLMPLKFTNHQGNQKLESTVAEKEVVEKNNLQEMSESKIDGADEFAVSQRNSVETQTETLVKTPVENVAPKVDKMEYLFDQILEALDNTAEEGVSKENVPMAGAVDVNQSTIEARCVVSGEIFSLPTSSWGKLTLKRGKVILNYKNTEREFLINQNELAETDESYQGPDNMVCPDAISEHDNRWLQKEIQKMKISRVATPQKVSSPKLKTPLKSGSDYHRYALQKSALKSQPNPFAFQGYKDLTVLAFQPKQTLARTPPLFK